MPSAITTDTLRRRRAGCPGCGQPEDQAFAPFCSRGCRDRDLLQWFDEGHRIPGRPVDPGDEDDGG